MVCGGPCIGTVCSSAIGAASNKSSKCRVTNRDLGWLVPFCGQLQTVRVGCQYRHSTMGGITTQLRHQGVTVGGSFLGSNDPCRNQRSEQLRTIPKISRGDPVVTILGDMGRSPTTPWTFLSLQYARELELAVKGRPFGDPCPSLCHTDQRGALAEKPSFRLNGANPGSRTTAACDWLAQ